MSPVRYTHEGVEIESRWSYAIPLEIIYLTPLTKWNPLNIPELSEDDVIANKRNGKCDGDKSKAFAGWNSGYSFFTPREFFAAGERASGQGDTQGRGDICALDANGDMHFVKPSGKVVLFFLAYPSQKP